MTSDGRALHTAVRARKHMASSASVQLFCLPYAGASASVYCKWQSSLPSWIEVCPVELPGHGRNIAEAPLTTVAAMVERVLPTVQRSLRGPFALFGHSMGAVLAFELAFSLESSGRGSQRAGARPHGPPLEPLVVFASGTDAPSRRDQRRYRKLESDEAIITELERLAGTPAAVLADAELMELALPILRADFAACAAYGAGRERRIRCPIQVFGGALDTTTPDGLEGWRDHTSGECSLQMFSGGHFFIHDQVDPLLEHVVQRLHALCAAGDRGGRADAPFAGDSAGLGRPPAAPGGSLARDPAHG